MSHETANIPRWVPLALVATLGASTLAGAGMGIAESPAFTSSADPISADCFAQPFSENGLPGPTQDTTAQTLEVAVQDIHHTHFFATDFQLSHGIEARAFATYDKTTQQIRGNAAVGVMPKVWGTKQEKEFDKAQTQLNYDVGRDNATFLRTKGITVRDITPGWSKDRAKQVGLYGQGPNERVVSTLEFIPQEVIRASGIRQIDINTSLTAGTVATTASDLAFEQPKEQNGVLTVDDAVEIPFGIAEMVLNNCPDKQTILDVMTNLNDGTPYNYNPGAKTRYGNEWQKKYGDIFRSPSSMTSAEIEFIEMFTDAIQGQNIYNNQQTNTVLGQKQQVVQSIFDQIVPGGGNFEAFWNFEQGYGNPDSYTPNQIATILFKLVKRINEAPTPADKEALMQSWNAQF